MAVLEKIRVKFGLAISIIIALALLSFIIDPGTLESALQGMSSKYDVGKIGGRSIRYSDFLEDVDRYTTINELLTGTSVKTEEQQKEIRDAAWQELVDRYMFVKNAKDAGITVGNAELVDLTTGSNPSPVVLQTFSGSEGYDPQVLVDFVQNQVPADETGRLQTYWNYLQSTVSNQQFYAKYGALFTASSYQNALEEAESMVANNTTADIDYIRVMYPYVQDTTVTVTNDEIKKYYKAHPDFFQQLANRDIEYVVFEVRPSDKDVAEAGEKVNAVYEEFSTTDNMKAFLLRNSDRPLSDYWYKTGELGSINSDVNDFVATAAAGAVSPVYKNGDDVFFAARVLDVQPRSDSAFVRHIMLDAGSGNLADSLVNVLKRGGNFTALAAQYSLDQNSQADGELGSIGWLTQSLMIPGFESVIDAKAGEPFVLNTQYGTHVVVVSRKTAPVVKKRVAILEKASLASKETFNEYYSQANRFASIANHTLAGYNAAVDSTGVYSHQMNVTEATSSYGAIDQAKQLTRWIFDNKAGKASDIITINNNYFFVAAIKEVHKEGTASLNEVASNIRQRIYTQKLAEVKKAEVAEKVADKGNLERMADILDASVSNEPAMSLSTTGRSLDAALLGAALSAPEGKICGPLAGGIATYMYRVNKRDTGSFFTQEDARQLAAQRAEYNTQLILPVMSQLCDLKDYRERFF